MSEPSIMLFHAFYKFLPIEYILGYLHKLELEFYSTIVLSINVVF